MEYALELENVSKTYEKSGFCLDRVSFRLPTGTVMGFVGENGAGKTTTIGCILNTLFKDAGEVRLFGQQMGDEDVALREKIGVAFIRFGCNADFSCERPYGDEEGKFREMRET